MSTAFCLNQHYYVNNGKLHLTISTTIKTECIADIITVRQNIGLTVLYLMHFHTHIKLCPHCFIIYLQMYHVYSIYLGNTYLQFSFPNTKITH